MANILNIFDFSDYRLFLRRWLERAKSERSFNLTRLAEVAQVHPTFLSQVLSGAKELSLEQAAFIGRHLGLTKLELEYFFVLLQLDRAGTQLLKEHWLAKKKEIESEKNKLNLRFQKHHELNVEQRALFYSSWIYSAIWSATAIEDGQTMIQIAERFNLSRERAAEILAFLTQTGLCNEFKGLFTIGDIHVHVSNESPFVVKHHTNWRMKGIQRMDSRGPSELFFTAPMSIAKKDFEAIREKLNLAVKDIVDTAKESPAEEVVCLNIDFFYAWFK